MNVTTEREWAAKTAMRLHIWQESFAEDDPDTRGASIWEYIAGAFAELRNLDEGSFVRSLKALDEEFPFYRDRKAVGADLEYPSPDSPPTPPPQTAKELLASLLAVAPSLKEDEREEISRQLKDAGFQVAGESIITKPTQGANTSGLPMVMPEYAEEVSRLVKTVEKIQSALGGANFKAGEELNLIRSMQMLGLLSEQFLLLHPQVWSMWESMVTNHQYTTSFSKPAARPDELLAKFLLGATTAKRTDVGTLVAKTFYLAMALIAGVEMAGKEFASWFFDKFGPQNIESVIQYEANGVKVGPEEYWQRYRQMSESHTVEELSEQFNNLLGRNMIRYMQQRRPGV
ncbi:hypothetical protein [Prosthecobacter sp.]|uniref:hypothetical protein n=1 Tax=Prosthecobacter sp. TaxID=1965333 RepID=UPI003783D678